MEKDSIYMTTKEGEKHLRLVDFVLVSKDSYSAEECSLSNDKMKIYLRNLEKEGLEMEFVSDGSFLRIVKIHASMDVLKRYAEILKLRMPIRNDLSSKMLYDESAVRFDLRELELSHEKDSSYKIVERLKLYIDKLKKSLSPRQVVDQADQAHLTAIYSRNNEYLFVHDSDKFFTSAMRSMIVEFILERERFSDDPDDDFAFGITNLISDGVFIAAYPLHDGGVNSEGTQRRVLLDEWASLKQCYKFQPLDSIRDYYGVKMALYFAWLGYYTYMLIPPSIVGIICFIYGIATLSSDIPTSDICEGNMANTTMCPICDPPICDFWYLSEACLMSQIKHLFDNDAAVVFAIFMSMWGAIITEFWKRYSAEITHRWDVFGYVVEEQHPRPQYLAALREVKEKTINFVTETSEPKPPFWRMKLPGILISWSSIMMFILLVINAANAIIVYRVSIVSALAYVNDSTIQAHWTLFVSTTGAIINLVLIIILDYIYSFLAVWLTDKELHRTQTSYDDALTVKIYLFHFVNFYGSIFYIAFFKGWFIGTPNDYNRIFYYWRQEECLPGGCFTELWIQLAIIFVGKQFFMAMYEYLLPVILKIFNQFKLSGFKGDVKMNYAGAPQYIKDFNLLELGHYGLFQEYLEMVIQFGFVTIFVTAFPLAPFFAFLNNVLELRLDARKFLLNYRRPVAQKVRNIGVWFEIMETLVKISIVTNALIIAMTSEFIPRTLYRFIVSEDGTLKGYVDFTLSKFDSRDMDKDSLAHMTATGHRICRYPDYKKSYEDTDHKYENSLYFFHIWFARIVFVVVFQNVVAGIVLALKIAIPDIPEQLKYRMGREAYLVKELMINKDDRKKGCVRNQNGKMINDPSIHEVKSKRMNSSLVHDFKTEKSKYSINRKSRYRNRGSGH